jgi:cytochrome c556
MILITGLMSPVLVQGAAEPEDIIKYRQAAMKASGGHMAASAAIVKGKVPFTADLPGHARALEQLTKGTAAHFPAGSDFGKTKALEAVWKDRAEFEKAARTAEVKAKAFAKAAAGKDLKAAAAAHKDLGDACGACHKKFRKKDE